MSDRLDTILVDPETKGPLARATEEQLLAIRAQLSAGTARREDGGELPAAIDGAYVAEDGKRIYPIVAGLPSFVVEERLVLEEAV